jgi:hypothetical protein
MKYTIIWGTFVIKCITIILSVLAKMCYICGICWLVNAVHLSGLLYIAKVTVLTNV